MSESGAQQWRPVVLDERVGDDRRILDGLRDDAALEFLDQLPAQLAGLRELRPAVDADLLTEPSRQVYYPWRRTVVALLGPRGFRALRLDRNRNLITSAEQDRLHRLKIGVAGLSVGHVIAHTLAAQGICGELWLADFDGLELSNLNRVPASVFDLGVNKAVVAARRIAELDPYLPVHVQTSGVTPDTVGEFVDAVDIVVEECDSLDIKAIVREVARAHRKPVLMATSDRGLVDVERFDAEPDRPILHGLLGTVDAQSLAGMSARDKIPHMLGHLDVPGASGRAAASMVEVGRTLTTWPQLAGDVALGATAIAEAVRRIGLGEALPSGRTRIDVAGALDDLFDPAGEPTPSIPEPAAGNDQSGGQFAVRGFTEPSPDIGAVGLIAEAANRAPSGGNAQPWRIDLRPDAVTITLRTECSTAIDVGHRGAAVAVGAAVFNARVAAAAIRALGPVTWQHGDDTAAALSATVTIGDGAEPKLAGLYDSMLRRETNRNRGIPATLDEATIAALQSTAADEGARLRMVTAPGEIDSLCRIAAAADRLRYLTPRLHAEMIAELRWPGDPEPDIGIDVGSLGLDDSDVAVLEILRRPDVMAHLARWDAGSALGDDIAGRIRASSALAVVTVDGQTLRDYARGGGAAEAVWIVAQQHGLAVQPISPVFLHANDACEMHALSTAFGPELQRLSQEFRSVVDAGADTGLVLLLRFADAPPTSVRSRRRRLATGRQAHDNA